MAVKAVLCDKLTYDNIRHDFKHLRLLMLSVPLFLASIVLHFGIVVGDKKVVLASAEII